MNLYAVKDEIDVARELTRGRLVLRAQTVGERDRIAQLCPSDQTRTYTGRWVDENTFVFDEAAPVAPATDGATAAGDARAKLATKTVKELKTIAGEAEVEWDPKASRDTMIDRILEKTAPAPGDDAGAEE